MKSKQVIAQELGISRKTLYNYMNSLNINDLSEENINIIREFISNKNKSKNISKSSLVEELENLKLRNAELKKQNESLEKGQEILLEQIEYYKLNIDNEIKSIKDNLTLLLNPPKVEKHSFFSKIFKK